MGDLLSTFFRFGGAMAVLCGLVAGALGWVKPGIVLLPSGLVAFGLGCVFPIRRAFRHKP